MASPAEPVTASWPVDGEVEFVTTGLGSTDEAVDPPGWFTSARRRAIRLLGRWLDGEAVGEAFALDFTDRAAAQALLEEGSGSLLTDGRAVYPRLPHQRQPSSASPWPASMFSLTLHVDATVQKSTCQQTSHTFKLRDKLQQHTNTNTHAHYIYSHLDHPLTAPRRLPRVHGPGAPPVQ